VRAGFGSDLELKDLFDGLPVELRAELPTASTEKAKLLRGLRDLNRRTGLLDFEERTSLHVVLRAACVLKSTDAVLKAALQPYIVILSAHEAALKQAGNQAGQGITSMAIPDGADFKRIATTIAKLRRKSIVFEGMTDEELASPVRSTQITFQGEVKGLKMLRALAPRTKIRPYVVEELEDKFILRAKKEEL
jgi:hypothetical protein